MIGSLLAVFFWRKNLDPAAQAYTEAIRLKPDNPALYIARAKAYMAARKFPQARIDLEEALQKSGNGTGTPFQPRESIPWGGRHSQL